MATPQQINENKRRQAYLRSLGYRTVPQDGSWGPWQESLWRKATTRNKQYPVSPVGQIQRGWDILTGNTTYRVEHPEGDIVPATQKTSPNMATVTTGAVATGTRANPYTAAGVVPLVIGSSLLLGNGPEIMRSLDDAGRSIKQKSRNLWGNIVSRFDDIEDREEPNFPPAPVPKTEDKPAAKPSTENSDTTSTSTPEPPEPPEDDKGKEKKDSKFKQEAKKVASNIGKGYGRVLKGAAYGLGFLGVPGMLGYAIYEALKPESTEIDQLLESQDKQYGEILKYQKYKKNQERIDSILRNLEGTSSTTSSSSDKLPEGFVSPLGVKGDSVAVRSQSGAIDSIINRAQPRRTGRFGREAN